MVTAVIYLDASDPEGFGDALSTTGHLFEDVEGFHGFDLLRGIEETDRFLLLAKWDSVGDHEAWQQAHVDEFLRTLNPYLSSPPDIKHFE
jgi:heme-degrading monooxygenase HmoA